MAGGCAASYPSKEACHLLPTSAATARPQEYRMEVLGMTGPMSIPDDPPPTSYREEALDVVPEVAKLLQVPRWEPLLVTTILAPSLCNQRVFTGRRDATC